MTTDTPPTFGQLVQYLTDVGFAARPVKPGRAAYTHPESGAVFLLRDRGPDAPALGSEVYEVKTQLTHRGVVSDAEFERFLKGTAQPAR